MSRCIVWSTSACESDKRIHGFCFQSTQIMNYLSTDQTNRCRTMSIPESYLTKILHVSINLTTNSDELFLMYDTSMETNICIACAYCNSLEAFNFCRIRIYCVLWWKTFILFMKIRFSWRCGWWEDKQVFWKITSDENKEAYICIQEKIKRHLFSTLQTYS